MHNEVISNYALSQKKDNLNKEHWIFNPSIKDKVLLATPKTVFGKDTMEKVKTIFEKNLFNYINGKKLINSVNKVNLKNWFKLY